MTTDTAHDTKPWPKVANHAERERAIAFCEMHECIEMGDARAARKLAHAHDIRLSCVWAPEDDGLEDASAGTSPKTE